MRHSCHTLQLPTQIRRSELPSLEYGTLLFCYCVGSTYGSAGRTREGYFLGSEMVLNLRQVCQLFGKIMSKTDFGFWKRSMDMDYSWIIFWLTLCKASQYDQTLRCSSVDSYRMGKFYKSYLHSRGKEIRKHWACIPSIPRCQLA